MSSALPDNELPLSALVAKKQTWMKSSRPSNLQVNIVFSDMDDTLLSNDKSISDKNLEVLDYLAKQGIPFVPTSGRALSLLPHEVLTHPASRYAITADGATVNDLRTEEVLYKSHVKKEDALALFELMKDLPVTFDVFSGGRAYTDNARREQMKLFRLPGHHKEFMLQSRIPYEGSPRDFIAALDDIERLGSYWSEDMDAQVRPRVEAALAEVGAFSVTSSMGVGAEILAKGTSKGTALLWLCKHLGLSVATAAAFGDADNDKEMLATAGIGVAMGNGNENVLRAARFVTYSNEESGEGRFLEWALL